MPTSVYFDTESRPEQNLYEDLIIEQLRVFGQDVFYLPRKIVNLDDIFGEDPLSSFNDAYMIEMYVENVEGFDGEKELMTKFGLDISNEITFVISRRRWQQFISLDQNLVEKSRPNEGDLIYFPMTKYIFEIGFVDHDDPFYQLHNLPIFKLKCRTFEYSSEEFNTGIEEINQIEDTYSLSMQTYQISLENEVGSLVLEDYLTGSDVYYIINEDYKISEIEKTSQNQDFEILNDNILDFTESNPFGDVI